MIFLFGAVCLLGWFGTQTVQAQDHNKMLTDSGFKQWNVDTPQEKAFFKDHPTDKFVTYKRKNKIVHVFKDIGSGIVYAGDNAAHQLYLDTAKGQNMTPKSQQDYTGEQSPGFWQMWAEEQGGG
jgi:hypothetical protein